MFATFSLMGGSHLAALAVLGVLTFLLVVSLRKDESSWKSRVGLALLAFFCLAAYPINQLAHGGTQAGSLDVLLPLHLCDLAALLCGLAILTKKETLCELSYFWGLAGTLQGLLTPDLHVDFPNPVYFSFFLHHGVVVMTALVLPLGLGWRARAGAPLRAFGWLLAYAGIIYLVNLPLGTNFGFLMEKPQGASLLDVMGPHPLYILWLILLAGLFFLLLHLPVRRKN